MRLLLNVKYIYVSCLESDNQSFIDKTIERFGKLDVLINNAGEGRDGSIETATLADIDFAWNTNTRSVFHLTSLAVPHLIKTKGNVVNVSSVAGLRSFPGFLPYGLSKAALDQFTKCISLDLAPKGVRVNSVNPALIVTNFHKKVGMDDETYDRFCERAKVTHPIGRPGTTSEVAHAIAFLADNKAASFITGTLLAVDGGMVMSCPR